MRRVKEEWASGWMDGEKSEETRGRGMKICEKEEENKYRELEVRGESGGGGERNEGKETGGKRNEIEQGNTNQYPESTHKICYKMRGNKASSRWPSPRAVRQTGGNDGGIYQHNSLTFPSPPRRGPDKDHEGKVPRQARASCRAVVLLMATVHHCWSRLHTGHT
ncbi:hypothetical protein Pcinc_023408 [Petrolisthes cinctipes]|uniref:Uncharacterized protein n=1 Tax=Petrolisthes cinctipes TaxID=88211 RepID=A0AAE1FBX6_PETCI|nr:hypothetical protein Pcinc_023408 [Petrolisthes cinctipes]